MPVDSRTPVIAGVGQVTNRPDPSDRDTRTEPLALMAQALELAGSDAARSGATRSSLLEKIDELTAIPSFVWHVRDPARAVAERLGVAARSTRLTFPGGTVPQSAVFDAASRIASGELDVAVVVGAEAMKSRDLARRHEERVTWHVEADDVAPAPPVFDVPDAMNDVERAAGLMVPAHAYALIEHARRRARGLSRAEHLDVLGALAARMSEVATRNEHAWLRDQIDPPAVTAPSPANRMIAAPYTKLLTSNVVVDMGAALIVCSLEAARAAGVPEDQLVFPVAGAFAREQWLLSERDELCVSLAMRACARWLFGDAPPPVDDLAMLDLYSCFPCAVQLAGDALGIDVLTDERPPSVTGGMTFFGGPGNNYVTHSIATMTERLRRSPGATGLVTGLGWYLSTHSWGTYSTSPPRDGFRARSVQTDVDAVALRAADDCYTGPADVESYTVVHDRAGLASRAIVSLRTPAGARRLLATDDREVAAGIMASDPLGERAAVGVKSISFA
ncbi:MAG TPA: hypothetical protein VMQ40_01375 [Acidimicrobiales bacterium]|nr:hypothetical protein [Acidimicrobiales bacterium]